MAASNSLILLGNLTRDPETKQVGGKTKVTFGLAVNGVQKDKPLFVDVEIWERKGELVADSFGKGSRILVSGELALDTWESKDGDGKRQKHYMKAFDFSYVDKKGEASASREEAPSGPPASTRRPSRPAPQPAADDDEDDVPF